MFKKSLISLCGVYDQDSTKNVKNLDIVNKFWSLIDNTRNRSNKSYKNQLGLIKDRFQSFSPEELIFIDNTFNDLTLEGYTWDLFGASSIVMKNQSNENLLLFLSFLISRGEVVYNNCLVNVDIINNQNFSEIDDSRLISDVIAEVYLKKTNGLIPMNKKLEYKLIGEEWTIKELPSRFIKIWNKFA